MEMVANRKNRKNKNAERRTKTDDNPYPPQKRRTFTPPPGLGESDQMDKFINKKWFSQLPQNHDDTISEAEKLQKHWEQIVETSAFKQPHQNNLGLSSTSSHQNELRIEIPPEPLLPILPYQHEIVPLRHDLNFYPPPPPVVQPTIIPPPVNQPPIVPPPDAHYRHRDQEIYFDILPQIKMQEEQKQQWLQQQQEQRQRQEQEQQQQQPQQEEQKPQEQEQEPQQQPEDNVQAQLNQMILNADAAPFYPRTYFEKVYPSPPQSPNRNLPNIIQPPLQLEPHDPNNWEYLRARYSLNLADRNRLLNIGDDFRTCGFCNLYIAHKDLLREHVKAHHNNTPGYINYQSDFRQYDVEPQTDYQKSLIAHARQNCPTYIYDEAVAQGRLRPYAVPINFMMDGHYPRYPAFHANPPPGFLPPPYQNQRRDENN